MYLRDGPTANFPLSQMVGSSTKAAKHRATSHPRIEPHFRYGPTANFLLYPLVGSKIETA